MKENLVKPTKNHIILCYSTFHLFWDVRHFVSLSSLQKCNRGCAARGGGERRPLFSFQTIYSTHSHTGAFGCSRPSLMLFRFGPARYQQPSSSSSYVRTSKGFSGEGGLLAVCNQATREIFVRFSLSSHFSRIWCKVSHFDNAFKLFLKIFFFKKPFLYQLQNSRKKLNTYQTSIVHYQNVKSLKN